MARALVVFGYVTSVAKETRIQYSDANMLDGETFLTVIIQTTQESSVTEH